MPSIPRLGTWTAPGQTQTANTAIFVGVPPWPGRSNGRFLYNAVTRNWLANGGAVTHVTSVVFSTGSTLHSLILMRPTNYTTLAAAAAAGATTLVLTADPGIYSTGFKYPLPAGLTYPLSTADNGIATNDYIAYQLADGTWGFAKVTNVSTLTVTVAALPSPTGTGSVALAGALVYFFGISTDVDPSTGAAHPSIQLPVSVTSNLNDNDGLASAVHAGDPVILFDANATAADTIAQASGYYGKY